MNKLIDLECIPCRGGEPPLTVDEISDFLLQTKSWKLIHSESIDRITKVYVIKKYSIVLDFVNQVAELAESQDHHPRIIIEWGRVTITWWTHIIKGLHKNDFISAAKTDAIFDSFSKPNILDN